MPQPRHEDTELAAEIAASHPHLDADTVMLRAQAGLLSTRQAADLLGVKRQWVWRLVHAGRLPATKVGRDWLIAEADLERLERRPVGRPHLDAHV